MSNIADMRAFTVKQMDLFKRCVVCLREAGAKNIGLNMSLIHK